MMAVQILEEMIFRQFYHRYDYDNLINLGKLDNIR